MSRKIVLNLNISEDARKFDYHLNDGEIQMVHYHQFQLVKEWIDNRFKNPPSANENQSNSFSSNSRQHDTITILGTRGSGKTSFLLSVQEYYKTDKEIVVLKIIDPTLIEEKGHVFLNIISLIKDKVDDEIDTSACRPGDKHFAAMTRWNKLMEDFAHGLPSMDGIGGGLTDSHWQDAEYIMQRGLRSVSSARKLEDNFKKMVEFSLEILGKKAYLIAFDDIDVDFKRGWPVLETIRKYLTSPQLITLISGDLRLYSISIRKQQWQNFGKAVLINEGDRLGKISYFDDLVTEMEGQYLLKVLKPERRIRLNTLNEKVNSPRYNKEERRTNQKAITDQHGTSIPPNDYPSEEDYHIVVRRGGSQRGIEMETEIIKYYNEILSTFGIKNTYLAESYRSFLLSRPLRMQVRILIAFQAPGISNKVRGILEALISDLYEKRVNVDLASANYNFINIVIFDLLLREDVLNDSYQLQPTTTDESLNASLLGLSLLFSSATAENTPYLIFDYLVRIGSLRNLTSSFGDYDTSNDSKRNGNYYASLSGISKHIGIKKDNVLRDTAGLMNAYMLAHYETMSSSSKSFGGIIKLKGLAEIARRRFANRIDIVFESKEYSVERTLAYLPLSMTKHADSQSSILTYSFYTLLGAIGELIRRVKENDFDRGILELSQIRTYPMPKFGEPQNSVDDSQDEEINTANKKPQDSDDVHLKLKPLVEKWVSDYYAQAYSPHLLGKIATRSFYAFDNISDRGESQNLGDMMHFRTIAFLNAVLIEDVKEHIEKPNDLDPRNTNYKDDIFIQNLNNHKQHKMTLKLSRWLLSCPMLLCFLEERQDLKNAIGEFCELEVPKWPFTSIHSKLNHVALAGPIKRASKVNPV